MTTKRRKLSRDGRNGQYYVRIQVGGVRKYFSLGLSRKKAEVELTRLERLHAQGELAFNSALETPALEPLVVKQAGVEVMLKELMTIHLDFLLRKADGDGYEGKNPPNCKYDQHCYSC
jgi:hypothetical protein